MSEEDENEDIVDIEAVLYKVVDKMLYKKAKEYIRKELSVENMRKHFEVVCTEGRDPTSDCTENIEYGSYDDISNTCSFLIHKLDCFWCDDRYSCIISYYNELTEAYHKLCDISHYPDYNRAIKLGISAYNEHGAESYKYKILGDKRKFFLNPKENYSFLETLFVTAFKKGAAFWKKELRYSRNANELIEIMDKIIALNIPCLNELARNQRNIYSKLLEKENRSINRQKPENI